MIRKVFFIISLSFIMNTALGADKMPNRSPIAIAIHGGAGTILKKNLTPETEKAYHDKLTEALNMGYQVLKQDGTSVEAVQTAIVILEDSELFNAGKGAVFTHHKTNEMDASIMDGNSLMAGAVAGVGRVKNPIILAHAVMTQSRHVLLSGKRAEDFAREHKIPLVDSKYFYTDRRWNQLVNMLKNNPDETDLSEADDKKVSQTPMWPDDNKFGTVGAVALDQRGNLAAGTSTGGMTNKKYGRIGDSPIIGAGTYADNQACAISATGHGEFFIRAVVAHDICARVLYKKIPLQKAADEVILEKLVKMQGNGGIIGLTPLGDIVFSLNTAGMYRGYIDTKGKMKTLIYKD